jgi:hypothetical protein
VVRASMICDRALSDCSPMQSQTPGPASACCTALAQKSERPLHRVSHESIQIVIIKQITEILGTPRDKFIKLN